MKKPTFQFAIIAMIVSGVFITSCQTPSEKVADAKANVVAAKEDLKDMQKEASTAAMEEANNEEWQLFKMESEAKIRENEVSITQLKAKMKTSGKNLDSMFEKNIEALEEKNKSLNAKIESYDKNRSDWEAFKREFNHDMEEFGNAFKDLTVNNKK
jgi:chromosome segregation ATPase